MKKKTKMIHSGRVEEDGKGAVSIPIYQVSTYQQDSPGQHKGYEYSRTGNPTRQALENIIADLEHGETGFAFGSGMAAITSTMMLFDAGSTLVMTDEEHGWSHLLETKVLNRFTLEYTYVDTSFPAKVEAAIWKNTKALFIETPTYPLLKVTNIAQRAEIAKEHDLLLTVD